MRFDKFTIKSQELIQNAQSKASGLGHQQIEPEHFLAVMLEEQGGRDAGHAHQAGGVGKRDLPPG